VIDDPVQAFAELLTQSDALIEEYALLAESTRNDSIKLGALKARSAEIGNKTRLLQAAGLFPHVPRWRKEILELAKAVVDAFNRHEVSEEARIDFLSTLGVDEVQLRRELKERDALETKARKEDEARKALYGASASDTSCPAE
jgi:hypothetical protein